MKAIPAPVIQAEMDEWVALGGGNSGIVGAYDGSHPTGFHRAGFEVSTRDYSRSHEPGRPYNLAWCCAGDFSHRGNAGLRARHATLLARLRADDPALSMICEFIGKPWPDQPVYYWARWLGVKNIKRYTGQGHDHWSHISWWRSRANERAYLWRPPPAGPAGPVSSTAEGYKMLMIASDNAGQLYVCDGITSRKVSKARADDVRYLANHDGAFVLWKRGEVRPGWTAEGFGALVAEPSTSTVQLNDAQLQQVLATVAARPDNPLNDHDVPTLVRAFKQAAREGAGVA